MQPQLPDDCINLEDSGTLDLGRLLTWPQGSGEPAADAPPEFPCSTRHGSTESRELLANPFASGDAK